MNHTTIELLLADYRGLRGAERDEVDAHVASCSACAARLAEYRAMDVELQGLRDARPDGRLRTAYLAAVKAGGHAPEAEAGSRRGPMQWFLGFAAAAAVLLIVATVWFATYPDRTGVEESPSQAAIPPAAAALAELDFQCDAITDHDALAAVIADFEAQNPDIKVHYTPVYLSGTDEASYNAAVKQAAETADVFCAMPSPTHLQIGAARDLAPFIAADASFQPDDFFPGLLFRWEEASGSILSVPTYFNVGLIAYKPAAFDEAGLPYPQPGWSWDDFLAVAVQLTQRQGDEIVRWGFSEVGTGLINRRLISAWNSDWQAGPDYASLANVLAWYETLYVRTQAAPAPLTLGWKPGKTYSDVDLDSYRNGNKSALWDASWWAKAETDRLAPYPEARPGEPQIPMLTLAGLVMSGQTAHPDASWRWISYLSQHLPDGEHIPARRSLAEAARFWSKLDPASAAAYRYGLDHLAAFPGQLPSDYVAQMEAVVAVVKGEKTAEQALADLAAQGHVRGAPGTPVVPSLNDLLPPTNGMTHTWRDYETALVRAILPATLANGVCDWQVLGHTGQEVYVWAFCAANQAGADITAASLPAVLTLADDGHTVTARIPRDGTYYPEDVRALFPADVQQQIFRRLPEATLSRLEQHARRRLTWPTLPPLGAAETVKPRPDISATGAHIALYSGRADPRWDLNELDLAQLDALLEGLPAVDCPPMPGQLGYRGVVVGLGMADESRMTAYGGTLWFGYPGANPQATCLADPGRSVERFLLSSAQPYLDPSLFDTIMAELGLPLPTPKVEP